jgi:hypothetical protein
LLIIYEYSNVQIGSAAQKKRKEKERIEGNSRRDAFQTPMRSWNVSFDNAMYCVRIRHVTEAVFRPRSSLIG